MLSETPLSSVSIVCFQNLGYVGFVERSWLLSLGVQGLTNGLVQEEGFANIFDLGDCAFEVEGFGEDDFEDLWIKILVNML